VLRKLRSQASEMWRGKKLRWVLIVSGVDSILQRCLEKAKKRRCLQARLLMNVDGIKRFIDQEMAVHACCVG